MAHKKESQGIERLKTAERCTREIKGAAIRDASGEFAIDDEGCRMWFRASTPKLWDDGKLIEVEAWRAHMDEFLGHGQFVDSHLMKPMTVIYGSVVDYRIRPDGLYEQVRFDNHPTNPGGEFAWHVYREGFATDVSIAWDTLARKWDTTPDGRRFERITEAKQLHLAGCVSGTDGEAVSLGRASDELIAAARSISCAVCPRCNGEDRGARPGWDEPEGGHMIHYQIRPPEDFDKGTMATLSMDVKGSSDVQVVRGKLADGDGEMHAQSIRFDKEKGWTPEAAKTWWASHKDELARGNKGDLAVEVAVITDETVAQIAKILALVTDIRTLVAALNTRENPYLPAGFKERLTNPPESDTRRIIRELAEAVRLTPEEVQRELKAIRDE